MFKMPKALYKLNINKVLVILGFVFFFSKIRRQLEILLKKQTCYMTFHFIRVKNVNSQWSSEDIIKVCRCCVFNICKGVWKTCRIILTILLQVLLSDSLLIFSPFYSLNSSNANIFLRHITMVLPILFFWFFWFYKLT